MTKGQAQSRLWPQVISIRQTATPVSEWREKSQSKGGIRINPFLESLCVWRRKIKLSRWIKLLSWCLCQMDACLYFLQDFFNCWNASLPLCCWVELISFPTLRAFQVNKAIKVLLEPCWSEGRWVSQPAACSSVKPISIHLQTLTLEVLSHNAFHHVYW